MIACQGRMWRVRPRQRSSFSSKGWFCSWNSALMLVCMLVCMIGFRNRKVIMWGFGVSSRVVPKWIKRFVSCKTHLNSFSRRRGSKHGRFLQGGSHRHTALHYAARFGHIGCIETLLRARAGAFSHLSSRECWDSGAQTEKKQIW